MSKRSFFKQEEEREKGKKIMVKLTKSENLVNRNMDTVGFRKCCQADECSSDLSDAKEYYKRHKVCERHAKAAVVLVKSIRQRFCQQCSKFHEISKFDYMKRSCRDRLADHNERRRKSLQAKDVKGSSPPLTNATELTANKHLNLNEASVQSNPSSSSTLNAIAGSHPNAANHVEMTIQNAPNLQPFSNAMMIAHQQRTFF